MRVNSKNQLVRSDQPCPTNWKDYRKNYDRIFKAVPQERPAAKPSNIGRKPTGSLYAPTMHRR